MYIFQMFIKTDEFELIIVMDVGNKYHVGPWGTYAYKYRIWTINNKWKTIWDNLIGNIPEI